VPLRGLLVCALLLLTAGNAAAVEGSMRPRSPGWIRWSDPAQLRAARDQAAAAPRSGALGTISWTGGGLPVVTTASGQFGVGAISDGAGGAIAGWVDYRDTQYDVYAMRLDGNGNRMWTASGVLVAPSTAFIDQILVMPDGANGAFFVFGLPTGGGYQDVLVQHVTALGAISAGWPAGGRSTVPGGCSGFGAVPTSDGFLLMGWIDPAGQLRLLRLTGAGAVAPGWNAAGLSLGHPANDGNVRPAPDGAGGTFLCWAASDSVMLTRVTSGGAVAAGWTAAGTVVASGFSLPPLGMSTALLTGGDVMVFWSDFRSLSDPDIFAMRLTAAGANGPGWPAGGVLAFGGANYQLFPEAVPDAAGGALVVSQMSVTPSATDSLVAERITATGALASGWTTTGVTMARNQSKVPGVPISDGASGVLTAWAAIKAADDDLFAMRVDASGAIPAGWLITTGKPVCQELADQNEVVIVPDGASGMIAVWEDYRDVAERVFATRVLSDGTVPALASLVSATAEPGLARLHWFSPDGASFEAGVERATGAGPFAEIARVRADGTGHVRYDDRDVTPGATYRYRLAVTENGATSWLGEVTLRVPEGSRLALAGFVPNPAVGKPRLAYTLPTAQRARIEVLDTAGRRVLERDLDSSPGEHVVTFDAALGPGVYTLRLTQGSRSVTARATIVR
jgi:hypothetical protein